MGLTIVSSDNIMDFYINYIGFSLMRAYFVLHYGKNLYRDYRDLVAWATSWGCDAPCPIDEEEFNRRIGDLSILINHSDCEGKLTSDECKRLRECLFVDEDKIREIDKSDITEIRIRLMHEFIEIVTYCADNDDVELLFW